MNTWWSDWASGSSGATSHSGGPRPATAGPGAAVLILWMLAIPGAAPAQQTQQLDSGAFLITSDQGPATTETFAIRREGETYQSAARITAGTAGDPGAGRSILEFRLQLDAELRPTFFELSDRRGADQGIVGVRSGNRIQLRARTPDGERWQELLLAPGLVVLPEGLAHPYYFVARMLASGADAPLPAILPGDGERRPLAVEGRTGDSVEVGGSRIPAERIDLRVGDGLRRLWIDDRGRLLRVEIPGGDWSAVRAAPPGTE